ncbi:hypothetical protein Pmani_005717 [Petrolisthes manimaculis]|uniref:Uncharacterized protein n=1 Tax=Petrolisthes manimaculis TaxID=1843537 RepID=A0AAE1QE28_9EUCA|nr:hypothetical protein Pmani_005717 [Petrolisthes manimaculis]
MDEGQPCMVGRGVQRRLQYHTRKYSFVHEDSDESQQGGQGEWPAPGFINVLTGAIREARDTSRTIAGRGITGPSREQDKQRSQCIADSDT